MSNVSSFNHVVSHPTTAHGDFGTILRELESSRLEERLLGAKLKAITAVDAPDITDTCRPDAAALPQSPLTENPPLSCALSNAPHHPSVSGNTLISLSPSVPNASGNRNLGSPAVTWLDINLLEEQESTKASATTVLARSVSECSPSLNSADGGAFSSRCAPQAKPTAVPSKRVRRKVAPEYCSLDHLGVVFDAYHFAEHQKTPLNVSFTENMRGHRLTDKDEWREARRHSLHYAFRSCDLTPRYVFAYENDFIGGVGLHAHKLPHVPPQKYPEFEDRLLNVLSKDYRQELLRIVDIHHKEIEALDLRVPRKGSPARDTFEVLASLKNHRKNRPKGRNDKEYLAWEDAVKAVQLPFYLQAVDKPHANVLLAYLLKQADPAITLPCNGRIITLGELLDLEDGVKLQRQSPNRFARRNLGATHNLLAKAQLQASSFIPPPFSLIELFTTSGQTKAYARKVRELITTMSWNFPN